MMQAFSCFSVLYAGSIIMLQYMDQPWKKASLSIIMQGMQLCGGLNVIEFR